MINWFFAGPEGSLELAQLLVRLGQLEAAETTLANTPLTKKAFVLAKVNTLQISFIIFLDKEINF